MVRRPKKNHWTRYFYIILFEEKSDSILDIRCIQGILLFSVKCCRINSMCCVIKIDNSPLNKPYYFDSVISTLLVKHDTQCIVSPIMSVGTTVELGG